MDEKSREAWEVSLAFLQDHRKMATVGAHCGCGHTPPVIIDAAMLSWIIIARI
ncbi:MAG TPA: hypothetical protein VKB42_04295 [Dongiaceae bacterium]|nr:hypothetical protein [Dongiaceae bacterium]